MVVKADACPKLVNCEPDSRDRKAVNEEKYERCLWGRCMSQNSWIGKQIPDSRVIKSVDEV